MTTKVHAVVDGLDKPLRFILSSGSRNNICLAKELLEGVDLTGKLILADKGYDSKKFTDWIESRGGIVVIPSRRTNKIQRDIDLYTYNERHLVENLFLKLKNNRRFLKFFSILRFCPQITFKRYKRGDNCTLSKYI